MSGTGQRGVIKMQVCVRGSSGREKKKQKYFLHKSFYYLVVISVHTRYKIIVLKVLITMHMKLLKCFRRFFDQLKKEGS